jgi:hypothetical protein
MKKFVKFEEKHVVVGARVMTKVGVCGVVNHLSSTTFNVDFSEFNQIHSFYRETGESVVSTLLDLTEVEVDDYLPPVKVGSTFTSKAGSNFIVRHVYKEQGYFIASSLGISDSSRNAFLYKLNGEACDSDNSKNATMSSKIPFMV